MTSPRRSPLNFIIAVLSTLQLAAADTSTYPHAELLVEPVDLARADAARAFVILDARDRKKFAEAHVPGARWLDVAAWAKGFGQGTDVAGWSERIGQLGISSASGVVVYDDAMSRDAGRIWWILRYWGVDNARLLNGGWKGWEAAKLAVEKGERSQVQAAKFAAKPRTERLATKEQLLKSLAAGGPGLQIVDARSEAEYCGTEKQTNKRGGAIPGAKNLDWVDLLDRTTHRFKGADDLRKLFASAGIDVEKPVATHCQSGGRASVMVFGFELLGAKNVSNYYASWAEWGNAEDTPVVPGKAKGNAPAKTK